MMALEVTNICRTCLGLECALLSIYKTKGFSNIGYVSDMITELTNIPSVQSDGFPENICLECIREINRCYSFKLKCEHSYSTLKQILLENPEELEVVSQEVEVSNNKTPKPADSGVKILNQTIIIPAPSNNSNLVSSAAHAKNETEICCSVACSNNLSIEPEAQAEIELEPDKEELMNSDTFEMMIEKMIFEDNEVDCLDPHDLKSCVMSPLKKYESENKKSKNKLTMIGDENFPHKKQSLLEPHSTKNEASIQVHQGNDLSQSNKNLLEYKSNTKKDVVLESPSVLNKDEYKIQLSCESLNFKSDIIVRNNSPKKKESSLPCQTCGKVFTLVSSLHNHMLTHSEERPFSCKQCGKTFRNKSSHKLHELRHTKDKPFKCEECKNSFVCLKELKTHKLIHKDVYPYVCSICFKEFRHANSLKSHIRIHTGEKPYVCNHCPKKYAQLTSLTTHHNLHLDKGISIKEMNECVMCKRFKNKKKQSELNT